MQALACITEGIGEEAHLVVEDGVEGEAQEDDEDFAHDAGCNDGGLGLLRTRPQEH